MSRAEGWAIKTPKGALVLWTASPTEWETIAAYQRSLMRDEDVFFPWDHLKKAGNQAVRVALVEVESQ